MDIETLNKFYNDGIYKELTTSDIKVIKEKKATTLNKYVDVLEFMLDNNCKVEQESITAVKILLHRNN